MVHSPVFLVFNFLPPSRHWIAVFSLKMDRELKILVEHLATKLRPETGKTIEIMTSPDQELTLN